MVGACSSNTAHHRFEVPLVIAPKMAVYSPTWEFMGYVEDAGTKSSERLARVLFKTTRVRLVPALVEMGEE